MEKKKIHGMQVATFAGDLLHLLFNEMLHYFVHVSGLPLPLVRQLLIPCHISLLV
jgi:hypothetical protein